MPLLRSLLILLTFLALTPQAQADSSIGEAIKVEGSTAALRRDQLYALTKTDPIFLMDELRTGGASRLEVSFKDGTKLYMGDHSNLAIDEMVYNPGEKGKAVVEFGKGVFRMVTGQINKVNGSEFLMLTPLATIGIRGTDFWGHHTDTKLTIALLDNGVLDITTADGNITLTKPLSAVVIEQGKPIGKVFTLTREQLNAAKATIE